MIQQLQMIEKLKNIALNDDAISAVLMYGSFIKGEGDKYSDIEFYIFLRNDNRIDKLEWISRIHPVDLFFQNEFGTDVAIFSNLIRGEFHFSEEKDIPVIHTWKGFISFEHADKMNLVDKDGILTETLNSITPPLIPIRNTPQNIEWLALSLVNNILFARNILHRKEFAHTHQLFSFIQRYILWLIRVATSSENHWESPTKKLEADIPDEWYERYKTCIPGLDEISLHKSMANVFFITELLFDKLNVSDNIKNMLCRIKNEKIS